MQIMDIVDQGCSDDIYFSWCDPKSDSVLLVYNDVEWVVYMSYITKGRRMDWYKSLNMADISD